MSASPEQPGPDHPPTSFGRALSSLPPARAESATDGTRRVTFAVLVWVLFGALALAAGASLFAHRAAEKERLRSELEAAAEPMRPPAGPEERFAQALAERERALAEQENKLREAAESRDAHLMTAQLMRVASLYKSDPLGALALLHDYEALPIDRRDAAWNFYANCCERRLRPDVLGNVLVTAVQGRRHNVYPVPHRDANGRVLALVETPGGKLRVIDLASGDIAVKPHPLLEEWVDHIAALSADGKTVGVWVRGKLLKKEESDQKQYEYTFRFRDVETGRWHKLKLPTAGGLLTPDGKRFVVHNESERIVYDVATGSAVGKVSHGEEFERVQFTCAVSADGKYLASFVKGTKEPGVVRIIDARTNKELAAVAPPKREIKLFGKTRDLTDPELKLGVELLQFSPDGKKLAIAYRYFGRASIPEYFVECHVVSVPDGARVGVHGITNSEFAPYVAFNQSGTLLAVSCGVGSDGTLGVYRTDPEERGDYLLPVAREYAWPVPPPHALARASKEANRGLVRGLSFASDDTRVAVAVQTDGGYHAVEADLRSGRLRLLPGSLPHAFGRENTDANVHLSSRNELLVVTEFGTLHRWRLDPDDAMVTLPHTSPHPELRHTGTTIAFAAHGSELFIRYRYGHWHDGKGRIDKPPAALRLHWDQWDMQTYSYIKALEPPAWKPRPLIDQAPTESAFPDDGAPPPPVSPDGRTEAVVAANGAIELRDTGTKRVRASLESHGRPVRDVRFSPDGWALASLDTTHVVKVWDLGAPALHSQWPGTAAAFDPDEKTVIVAGHRIDRRPLADDEVVAAFDLKTGRSVERVSFVGARAVSCSADGEVLAVGDRDTHALLARQGAEWKPLTVGGERWFGQGVRQFLPEPKVLAVFSVTDGGDWNGATPEQAKIKRGDGPRAATVLTGIVKTNDRFQIDRIVVGYRRSDKSVVVVQRRGNELAVSHYDPATGQRTEARTVPLKSQAAHLWTVLPGGERVVATDKTTGEFVRQAMSLQVIDPATGVGHPLPGDHTGGVACVAASPDGQLIASADYLGTVRLWRLAERRVVKEFWARGCGVESLALSPSGRYLAVAGSDGWVRVWNLTVLDAREEVVRSQF